MRSQAIQGRFVCVWEITDNASALAAKSFF